MCLSVEGKARFLNYLREANVQTYTVQTFIDLEFRDELKNKKQKKSNMSDILYFLLTCPLALTELSLY